MQRKTGHASHELAIRSRNDYDDVRYGKIGCYVQTLGGDLRDEGTTRDGSGRLVQCRNQSGNRDFTGISDSRFVATRLKRLLANGPDHTFSCSQPIFIHGSFGQAVRPPLPNRDSTRENSAGATTESVATCSQFARRLRPWSCAGGTWFRQNDTRFPSIIFPTTAPGRHESKLVLTAVVP